MTAEFIRKAQWAVHDAVFGQDDGVFQGSAANQAHGAQWFNVPLKAESSGPREHVAKAVRVDGHLKFLLAHLGMRKIDVATDMEFIRGVNSNATVPFHQLQRLQNPQEPSPASQPADAA